MNRTWVFVKDLYYFFPVQLLLLSFRRHHFFLLIWLFLFAILWFKFGLVVGTPFFLLDPEYLGHVGYLSFALVGIGFGTMFIAWNLAMYMLHSHRFPFLASMENPMATFALNNSLLPLIFIVSFIVETIRFQVKYEFTGGQQIALDCVGFVAGFLLVILVTTIYFQLLNRNARSVLQQNLEHKRKIRGIVKRVHFNDELDINTRNKVDYYFTMHGHIRHTRSVAHYNKNLTQLVFRHHHFSALSGLVVSTAVMLALGFVAEKPFFQVPTATSAFFFLSIIIALVGVFIYWAGGWGTTAIFAAVVAINYFSKYEMFGYQNRASGLNYETAAREYSVSEFRKLSSPDNIRHDLQYFRTILNNWQKKNKTVNGTKPKMVFVNVSGGGLRAGVFATAILQRADSLLGGALFPQTFLMTGASGGMFGITLLREQLIRQAENFPVNIYDRQLPLDIGKDLLNPMFVNAMSNDMLLPFHKTKIGKYETFRDRAVMLEKQLEINNPGCFNKTVGDYKQVEFDAKVPLVMWHLAVVNDSRKLFVSPHPVSFLMRPVGRYTTNKQMVIDGIDYGQFFSEQDGYATTVASVNRMNATFPWILPNAVLPTEPATMIMDGGALDNFGSEITLRFINSFKDWIAQNTSGVVVLQIRDTERDKEIEPMKLKTAVSKFSDPVGMFYNNLENIQDFAQSQSFGFLNEALKGNMQIIYFEYISEEKEQKAAMSLHLTEKAKQDILQSVERKNNQAAFDLLRQAMQ